MDKVVQTTAGVEEWAKGEVVSVEAGVALPEDIAESFVARALA